ncbi:hypothetical protein [Pedobacter sp. P26]|uniref:hypothetical protein n=1 Tax=Pedobacter sp. P26 TaxID=3423956 RepID=UPI003D676E04
MLDYFFIALPLVAIWVLLFLFCGRSWQLPAAFIPFCIWGLYSGNSHWKWLLIIPLLSLLVVDLHITVKETKFSREITILSYVLTIPFLVFYLFYGRGFVKDGTLVSVIWGYIFQILVLIFVSKFWFSDILLLFINRLSIKDKRYVETQVIKKLMKTVGRSTNYYVVFYNLGKMKVSGFFYVYLKFKGVQAEDRIEIVIKRGCLGTEFITGFPKILSR